jgi:oligosaccharide repeat unit polymerase
VFSTSDLVFAGILALCLICILHLSTSRGFRFSPVVLFFFVFTVQQALGSMFLLTDGTPVDRLARLALSLGIIGFTAGVWVVSVWARFRPAVELPAIRQRMHLEEPALGPKVFVMLVGYLLSTAIVLYYFRQGGGMPLVQGVSAMISGDATDVAQQIVKERRMELTYAEVTKYRGQGYVDQLRNLVLPYVALSFVLWGWKSKRRVHRLLGILSAAPVVLFLVATGQRHPMLAFLLSTTILGYVLSKPETHKKVLGICFAVGVVVFIVLSFFLGRYGHTGVLSTDVHSLFMAVAIRIFFSNAIGTLAVFRLFPNPEPFRWGTTWLNDMHGFLPGAYAGFSAWLYHRLYGVVGTASPMSFGEMYANFGLGGVAFGGALMGMLLQAMQVFWARRREYRAEHFVLYALGSMAFLRWAIGGVLGPIQYGLVTLPLLYALIHAGQHLLIGARESIHKAARGSARRATVARFSQP